MILLIYFPVERHFDRPELKRELGERIMPNWHENDLKKQFKRAKDSGWVPFFEKAGKDYKFPTDILMAIDSRETNMRNMIGDGGHGYGIMQIDDRSFPEWCHSGLWKDVNAVIQKGAWVLDSKRETIRNGQGKKLKIKRSTFTGKPNLTNTELLRTAIAAYNAGLWAYWGLSERDDPDYRTTGKDYSSDTLARSKIFKKLMRPV